MKKMTVTLGFFIIVSLFCANMVQTSHMILKDPKMSVSQG